MEIDVASFPECTTFSFESERTPGLVEMLSGSLKPGSRTKKCSPLPTRFM